MVNYIKTKAGYFYKVYENGKKIRISKEKYLKMKKNKKYKNTKKQKGGVIEKNLLVGDKVEVETSINDMLPKGVRGTVREKTNNRYIIDFTKPNNSSSKYTDMSYQGRQLTFDAAKKHLKLIVPEIIGSGKYGVIITPGVLRLNNTNLLTFHNNQVTKIPKTPVPMNQNFNNTKGQSIMLELLGDEMFERYCVRSTEIFLTRNEVKNLLKGNHNLHNKYSSPTKAITMPRGVPFGTFFRQKNPDSSYVYSSSD